MKKFFELVYVRTLKLENTESTYTYMSPVEQLTRYFGDLNVFKQFLMSGKRNKMYDHCGPWHGDFFQSPAYAKIMATLPEDGSLLPPLLLGIYRLEFFKYI